MGSILGVTAADGENKSDLIARLIASERATHASCMSALSLKELQGLCAELDLPVVDSWDKAYQALMYGLGRREAALQSGSVFMRNTVKMDPGRPGGDWVRKHRRLLGLTKEALAEQIGEYPFTISMWEEGRKRPSKRAIEKIMHMIEARGGTFSGPSDALPMACQWVRARRKALGLSQSAVAEKVGVATTTISFWETGRCRPRPDAAAKLMQVLGEQMNPLLLSEAAWGSDKPRVRQSSAAQRGVSTTVAAAVKRSTKAKKRQSFDRHWIRQRRKALGLSQARVADAVGVSPATVASWEAGRSKPRNDCAKKLYKTLGKNSFLAAEFADKTTIDGAWIRSRRKELSMTQAQLAEKIGVVPLTISCWESGRTNPRPHSAKKLSDVLSRGGIADRAVQSARWIDRAWIAERRKKLGLSQPGLADLIGVGPATIWCWENGRSRPRMKYVRKLRSVLRVRPDEVDE